MQTYLVGGAVRDKLIGFPFTEKDWVVVGSTVEKMLEQGFHQVGKDFPVFLHPITKEEYALARTERKTSSGHTGFTCYASPDVTLEEDLLRRDLTINAMAEDEYGNIIDPYGGKTDISHKLLRHVSSAFIEDPLRVFRIARFHARYAHFGFTIADETMSLIQTIAASGELETLAVERIWKEFERALNEQSPHIFIQTLDQANACKQTLSIFQQLPSDIFQTLAIAGRDKAGALICFALLFADMNESLAKKFLTDIKAPKQYQELALLICQYSSLYHQHTPNRAEHCLLLLEKTDAFRRPERFLTFLTTCHYLFKDNHTQSFFKRALAITKSISSKPFIDKGLSGQDIASALKKERLRVINNLLSDTHL